MTAPVICSPVQPPGPLGDPEEAPALAREDQVRAVPADRLDTVGPVTRLAREPPAPPGVALVDAYDLDP